MAINRLDIVEKNGFAAGIGKMLHPSNGREESPGICHTRTYYSCPDASRILAVEGWLRGLTASEKNMEIEGPKFEGIGRITLQANRLETGQPGVLFAQMERGDDVDSETTKMENVLQRLTMDLSGFDIQLTKDNIVVEGLHCVNTLALSLSSDYGVYGNSFLNGQCFLEGRSSVFPRNFTSDNLPLLLGLEGLLKGLEASQSPIIREFTSGHGADTVTYYLDDFSIFEDTDSKRIIFGLNYGYSVIHGATFYPGAAEYFIFNHLLEEIIGPNMPKVELEELDEEFKPTRDKKDANDFYRVIEGQRFHSVVEFKTAEGR